MVPLYLPLMLDEENQSDGSPIFYNGVNVYLEQKSPFYRNAPNWVHRLVGSERLLHLASSRMGKTNAEDVGEITLSMLRGEDGHQARELTQLIEWLKTQPTPDVICLSNSMLIGLARQLKEALGAPVVCLLQNEAPYIDNMSEGLRGSVWELMAERAAEVECFIAPSKFYATQMRSKLNLTGDCVHVIHNGISHTGYTAEPVPPNPPVLGFFARLCKDKGLDTLIDAFIKLKASNSIPQLRLKIGGGCRPMDEPFVEKMRARLHAKALLGDVELHPNLTRAAKQDFLKSLSVLSVPAQFGESFGFYIIEAMAAGVPVVQPQCASFPELVEATSGGVCYKHDEPENLAAAIEKMLHNPTKAKAIGLKAREVVRNQFSIDRMATEMAALFVRLTTKV